MWIAFLEVTKRPEGEEPAEIRDAWVGLRLPINSIKSGEFAVSWQYAMRRLEGARLKAHEWWMENAAPHELVFHRDCGKLYPIEKRAVPCTFGCSENAVAQYFLNEGCIALRGHKQTQELCFHHARKTEPIKGIEIIKIYNPSSFFLLDDF